MEQLVVSYTRLDRYASRGEIQSWPAEGLAKTNSGSPATSLLSLHKMSTVTAISMSGLTVIWGPIM